MKLIRQFSSITVFVKQGNYQPLKLSLSLGSNLGKSLQKMGIPLDFECGFNCECGTCAIQFDSRQIYEDLNDDQFIKSDEEYVLNTERKGPMTRLSCQIKVTQQLDGVTIKI